MRSERHWSIYLPALSIAILWAGILFWADRREPPLETLRLLALAVEAVAVPALYLWAFLRARGSEIAVTSDALSLSTGGRHPIQVSVDMASVANIQIAQSYLQKLVDAGQIRIELSDGREFVLDDMSAPVRLRDVIKKIQKDGDKESAA